MSEKWPKRWGKPNIVIYALFYSYSTLIIILSIFISLIKIFLFLLLRALFRSRSLLVMGCIFWYNYENIEDMFARYFSILDKLESI